MTSFNIVLFDDFETLDAFGQAEVIGSLAKEYHLRCHSLNGGIIKSRHNVSVNTLPFAGMDPAGV